MSAELTKAVTIRVPNDKATADDFENVLFTCTNTIARNSLPAGWKGQRWIIIRNLGAVAVWFGFSTRVTAGTSTATSTVAAAPTASAAGLSSQVGGYIAAGEYQRRRLPDWEANDLMFFIRICATGTSADILIEKGDGE